MMSLSDDSKAMNQGDPLWMELDAGSPGPPSLPGRADAEDFAPMPAGQRGVSEFIPVWEGEEAYQKRKEADDLLREAREKVAQLEQEAYEKGFAQGERDGFELGEKKAAKVVQNMENLLNKLGHVKDEIVRQQEKEIVEVVFAIAEKIVHFLSDSDRTAVRKAVLEGLRAATEKSSVVIKVNPEDLEYVENLAPELSANIKELRSITVRADSSVTRGGCLLETPYGDVDATMETRLKKIHQCLRSAFGEVKNAGSKVNHEVG